MGHALGRSVNEKGRETPAFAKTLSSPCASSEGACAFYFVLITNWTLRMLGDYVNRNYSLISLYLEFGL